MDRDFTLRLLKQHGSTICSVSNCKVKILANARKYDGKWPVCGAHRNQLKRRDERLMKLRGEFTIPKEEIKMKDEMEAEKPKIEAVKIEVAPATQVSFTHCTHRNKATYAQILHADLLSALLYL